MSRRSFCEACNMIRNGVKSRIALEHTCGLGPGEIPIAENEVARFERQRYALFPREVLQPIYEKWKNEHAIGDSAKEFYGFLLRQTK